MSLPAPSGSPGERGGRSGFTLLGGAARHFAGQITAKTLDLAAVALLTRSFGAAGFGTIALALTFQGIGASLGGAGFPNSLLRVVPRTAVEDRGRLLRLTLGVLGPVSILIGAVLVFGADWLAQRFRGGEQLAEILPWFGVGLPLLVAGRALVAYSRGLGALWPTLMALVLPSLVLTGFLAAGFPLEALSAAGLAYLLLSTTVFLVGAIGLWRLLGTEGGSGLAGPEGERLSLRKLLAVSLPLLTLAVFNQTSSWTDSLLLGLLSDTRALGFYHVAARVPLVLTLLLYSMSTLFAPTISRHFHRGETKVLGELYQRVTHTLIALVLPGVGVLMVAPDFVLGMFGAEFTRGVWVLRILAVAQLVNVGLGPVGLMMSMTRHEWLLLGTTAFATALSIGLNVALIPPYGATGAAVASAGGIIVSNVLRMVMVKRLLGVSAFQGYRTVLLLGLGAVAVAAGFLARAVTDTGRGTGAVLGCCCLILVYGAGLVGLRPLLPRFLSFRDSALERG